MLRLALSLLVALTLVPAALGVPGVPLASEPLAYDNPADIAVAPDGSLWFVDSGADQVVHLSADGSAVLSQFSTRSFGSADPRGLARASDGTLFIADLASLEMHHRNADGTAASNPLFDLSGLGISDPQGLSVLPSGDLAVLDGVNGSYSVVVIESDGTGVVTTVDLGLVGLSDPRGVEADSSGKLWVTDADGAVLVLLDMAGNLLGFVDLSGLGLLRPLATGLLPGGDFWTLQVTDRTLYRHDAAGAATGSPSMIEIPGAIGLGLRSVSGLSRDVNGHPWVVDSQGDALHRLSTDGRALQFSFDLTGVSTGITEIDLAPEGTVYLTDTTAGVVHVLDGASLVEIDTLTAAELGVTAIASLTVDPECCLWVVDPVLFAVKRRSLDGMQDLGGFAINPGLVTTPRDIEVAPDGTLWVVNAQGAASTLVHLSRTGTAAPPISSFAVGASAGLADPSSIALLPSGDILVSDPSQDLLVTIEGPPPVIAQAIHVDSATPSGVSAGDRLVLVFDQPISLTGSLEADDFTLSEPGDSLGAFTAAENPSNPTHLVITLGAGASLTVPGSGTGSSAIDVSGTIEPGDVVDAETGTPISPSAPRDIQFAAIKNSALIGPAGGIVSVVDSDDAVYRHHTLTVAPGALSTPQEIELAPPGVPTDFVNAIAIEPGEIVFAAPGSTLTMEYTDHDLHNGDGGLGEEPLMRIHQLLDLGSGLVAIPVTAEQTVDAASNTVTIPLGRVDAMGPGDGSPALYATLPLDTVDDRSFHMQREQGPARRGGGESVATLTVGGGGLYTQHQVRFPGYVQAPSGISVRIREANLFERHGFPETSGAVYAVEANQAVEFPIEVTVEFFPEPAPGDVLRLDGQPGHPLQMRLVQRTDLSQPFTFLPWGSVDSTKVFTVNVPPLPAGGIAVFGAAADPSQIPAELTLFSAD
ncbi:MAG: hypothetical protein HUU25_05465 [Candidatus Sumerlaeia bacterium]|nr:hypothetical protein [Candidatus Sumerlaeia bacterium]